MIEWRCQVSGALKQLELDTMEICRQQLLVAAGRAAHLLLSSRQARNEIAAKLIKRRATKKKKQRETYTHVVSGKLLLGCKRRRRLAGQPD